MTRYFVKKVNESDQMQIIVVPTHKTLVFIYIYIYIYISTHTHIYKYIYIQDGARKTCPPFRRPSWA